MASFCCLLQLERLHSNPARDLILSHVVYIISSAVNRLNFYFSSIHIDTALALCRAHQSNCCYFLFKLLLKMCGKKKIKNLNYGSLRAMFM